jgi:hypothetical protein
LLDYFEEADDKEHILRTIVIQQQIKIISRNHAVQNQKKVEAVQNQASKPTANKLLKSKTAKRKFED